MVDRIAFQGSEKDPVATKSLKLKSKAAKKPTHDAIKEEMSARFDDLAEKAIANRQNRNQKAHDLAQQYLKAIRNKTLGKNRGTIASDVEREIRSNLVSFAIEINNDESEEFDCMGSSALFTIVLKILLEQRDRINDLEYELLILSKRFQSSQNNE